MTAWLVRISIGGQPPSRMWAGCATEAEADLAAAHLTAAGTPATVEEVEEEPGVFFDGETLLPLQLEVIP